MSAVFLSLGCSTLPPVQTIAPNLAELCKDSVEKETLELQKVGKSVEIHHGRRFGVADPPDEGYPYECGLRSFVEIHWKLGDLVLTESVVENPAHSVGRLHDKSSDYYFYDAKMAGSELVVFLNLGYRDDKIHYRFNLNRDLRRIIRLTSAD